MNAANIGSRWQPGERVTLCTENGRYEHCNPSRHMTRDESMLQAALVPSITDLRTAREIRRQRILKWGVSMALFAVLGALLAWGGR